MSVIEIPTVQIECSSEQKDQNVKNDERRKLLLSASRKKDENKFDSVVQTNKYATTTSQDRLSDSISSRINVVMPTVGDKHCQHSNSLSSSNSDWLCRNEWRTDGQRRWSMATQKIKNLLAVSDTLNAKNKRRIEKTMSIEQKSIFLDKFSTRDRKISATGLIPKKSYENNHHNITVLDCASNISSTELKDVAESDHLKESKSNLSQSDDISENIIHEKCTCLNILFEPYSTLIYIWTWILITAIHYNLWIIVFRIAFPVAQHRYTLIWFILDYTADFIYLVDILVASRMSFLENGIYVNDAKRVMLGYLKSKQFAIDLLCLIPLDLIYIFMKIDPSLRLPRLIKFYKVFTGKRVLESMTNFPNLLRGVFWLHMMFLLMHFNCCFFFIISKYEGFGSNDWVYPRHEGVHADLVHRYMKCMYWSTLVLTTIGENNQPETTIECVYMVVCYITGIFIFATIVGQAGNVIQNMNASRMEFERQRDNTMQYMKDHNVPTHLQKRVRLWYDYTYSRGRFNGGDDINEATMLPDKMKTELALHVHLETLRKVSFLQKCQPEFLHDLVLKMKLHIFTPGDFIVRKGEIAREMYVISDGIAEVVSESGHILKVLQPGDFFGEIGLLSLDDGQNRRTADVRSCGYIELFVLSKDDVMASIQDYPQAQKILARHGRKRLALGSKAASGLRDETTSGSSNSDSEIDRKGEIHINTNKRRDSTRSKCRERRDTIERKRMSIEDNHLTENNSVRIPYVDKTRTTSLSLYGSQSKQCTLQKASSLKNHLHSSSNIIGPASSMKSLNCKYPNNRKYVTSSEDEAKRLSEVFLKPKRSNMRRSNSDIPKGIKRPKGLFNKDRMKAKSVCSDGDKSDDVSNSFQIMSSLEKRDDDDGTNDETYDTFLDSIKELYLERIQAVKRKKKLRIKCLKNRIIELEERHRDKDFAKEEFIKQQEDDFNSEILGKCEQIDEIKLTLQRKEKDFTEREQAYKKRIESLENELNNVLQNSRNGIRKGKASFTHKEKYELRNDMHI